MNNKSYSPKNKILFLYALMVFIVTGLLVRLVDTQILNGEDYARLAQNNRMYIVTDPEQRGVLLDRYSDPLVFNKPIYYKLDSSESLYSNKTRIDKEEAIKIMSEDFDAIRIEHEREYRYPVSTSHILGYIGSVSVNDLIQDSSMKISDKIGKMGLELEMQDFLKGEKGYKKFEINALGEKQHLVVHEEGVPGSSIKTTIDPYLSEVALRALGEKLGSVVILDGTTGDVLALVSTPTFDLSYFSETQNNSKGELERVRKIQSFFSHPQKLFFNRAVSGAYPPGSVFKLVTAMAGLENDKISSSTTVKDEGVLKVGEYSYANWYFTQHGKVEGEINLQKSLARSNDIYFYKVAEWVGPERIKEMAELFGFGKKTGIQLQAETAGLIPDPEWKQRILGERWFLGNTYHFGIGQGDLLVSPIQVAQMVQGMTNKGTICSPTIISDDFKTGYLKDSRCGEVGVLRENLDLVMKGMLDACSSGGTGSPFFRYNDKVRDPSLNPYDEIHNGAVACKTGTSEFGGADSRGYRRTHAWFAASFGTSELLRELDQVKENEASLANLEVTDPASEEQIIQKEMWRNNIKEQGFPKNLVVVVLVESDEVNLYREGSKDAGPVAKEIFDWMFADVVENVGNN
jgi:penicillin-binding protein 2